MKIGLATNQAFVNGSTILGTAISLGGLGSLSTGIIKTALLFFALIYLIFALIAFMGK